MCSQKSSIDCNILPYFLTYRNYIYRTIYKLGEGSMDFPKQCKLTMIATGNVRKFII